MVLKTSMSPLVRGAASKTATLLSSADGGAEKPGGVEEAGGSAAGGGAR